MSYYMKKFIFFTEILVFLIETVKFVKSIKLGLILALFVM